MNKGRMISSSAEFPHVSVYERDGARGKIYTIAFNNPESFTNWEGFFVVLAGAAAYFGLALLANIYSLWLGIAVIFLGIPALEIWTRETGPPRKMKKRKIELDYGHDKFRVFINNKLKLERLLSQLKQITVDRHPDTDIERVNRQERKKKAQEY